MIKNGWTLPAPPNGFVKAVAFYYPDGEVVLDWTREPQRDFATEHDVDPGIEWPFEEGTVHTKEGKPDTDLWKSVKITPLW